MLHLLQDEFPNVSVVEEIDNCIEAAMALVRELEMIREKKSVLEIQEAKLITDLLIPWMYYFETGNTVRALYLSRYLLKFF